MILMGVLALLVFPISFIITSMLSRMGIFFLLIGLLTLVFAFATGGINRQNLNIYCVGAPMVILGTFIWYRYRERTPAERFRRIKKLSSRKGENEVES